MGLIWLQFAVCTAVIGVPNIALGDALGSCIFNLLILLSVYSIHAHVLVPVGE